MPRMMIHQQLHDIATPHDHDVLSGRGNFVNYHAGNEHFRSLVRKHKVAYVACPKQQKGKFSRLIVEEIRARNPPGRFLKQDPVTKLWHDIGEKKALDKTRQALREGAPDIMKEMSGDDADGSPEGGGSDEETRKSPIPSAPGVEGPAKSPTSSVMLSSSTHSRTAGKKPHLASTGVPSPSNDLDDSFAGEELGPPAAVHSSSQYGNAAAQPSSPLQQQQARLLSPSNNMGNDLMGQHSQRGSMNQNQQGNGLGQHSHHGGGGGGGDGMGRQSQHGGLGQNSQHWGLGQHSQHGGLGQHSQHGGLGQHSQHGGLGQHSQHGGLGQHSQHGGLGHSQHGGMGPQGHHSNHGQHNQLNNSHGPQQSQLSPSQGGTPGAFPMHPGMNMSDMRQTMQQQQQQHSRMGGGGNAFSVFNNGGAMFQTNPEVSLQNKIASLTQMQHAMYAQQQQYQQQKPIIDDDDGDEFEFEPRPLAPTVDSMSMPQVSGGRTNESVGMMPQLRKAPARIPRRGDMEREGSEKSLKMDSVFAKEIAAEIKSGQPTSPQGSTASGMSISIGELGTDIIGDSKEEEDPMPPPKSLNAQELFEGEENQDELVQLFDNSMRINRHHQKTSSPSKASVVGDGSDIGRVFDMSVATLGDSGVMYTGDASLGMSLAESFSNVFDEVDKDLYVGSN